MNWELELGTGNWKARWGPDVDDATKPTVCNPMPGTRDQRCPVQITEKTKSQAPKPDREERRGGERSGEERRGEERRGEERSGEERRGEERRGEERRKEIRKETLGDSAEKSVSLFGRSIFLHAEIYFFAVGEHPIPRFRSRKAKNSFRSRKPVSQSETGFAVATANCEFSQSAANLRSQDPLG